MSTIKAYLYCTKAKPWLCYDEQQKKYALNNPLYEIYYDGEEYDKQNTIRSF